MDDMEKMVNELTYQLHSKEVTQMHYPVQLSVTDAKKILELLKEQEPKSAIIEGSDVAHVGRCPSCHVILTPFRANYCYCCGEAVKWG